MLRRKSFLTLVFVLMCIFALSLSACTHEHQFASEWSKDATHHWHAATCAHKTEVSDKAEHTMDEGDCSVCGYHEHQFSSEWSKDSKYHWYAATCEHDTEVFNKAEHVMNDGDCDVCGYHEHQFSSEWSKDAENHWHVAICEHNTEVSDKAVHSMNEGDCSVCGYHEHQFSSEWSKDEEYHWHASTCVHQAEVADKTEHEMDGIICVDCGFNIEWYTALENLNVGLFDSTLVYQFEQIYNGNKMIEVKSKGDLVYYFYYGEKEAYFDKCDDQYNVYMGYDNYWQSMENIAENEITEYLEDLEEEFSLKIIHEVLSEQEIVYDAESGTYLAEIDGVMRITIEDGRIVKMESEESGEDSLIVNIKYGQEADFEIPERIKQMAEEWGEVVENSNLGVFEEGAYQYEVSYNGMKAWEVKSSAELLYECYEVEEEIYYEKNNGYYNVYMEEEGIWQSQKNISETDFMETLAELEEYDSLRAIFYAMDEVVYDIELNAYLVDFNGGIMRASIENGRLIKMESIEDGEEYSIVFKYGQDVVFEDFQELKQFVHAWESAFENLNIGIFDSNLTYQYEKFEAGTKVIELKSKADLLYFSDLKYCEELYLEKCSEYYNMYMGEEGIWQSQKNIPAEYIERDLEDFNCYYSLKYFYSSIDEVFYDLKTNTYLVDFDGDLMRASVENGKVIKLESTESGADNVVVNIRYEQDADFEIPEELKNFAEKINEAVEKLDADIFDSNLVYQYEILYNGTKQGEIKSKTDLLYAYELLEIEEVYLEKCDGYYNIYMGEEGVWEKQENVPEEELDLRMFNMYYSLKRIKSSIEQVFYDLQSNAYLVEFDNDLMEVSIENGRIVKMETTEDDEDKTTINFKYGDDVLFELPNEI